MIRGLSARRLCRRRCALIAAEIRRDPRSFVNSPRLRAGRLCCVCVMVFNPSPSVASEREEEGENPTPSVDRDASTKRARNARGAPVDCCRVWQAKTFASMGARVHFRSGLERSARVRDQGGDGTGDTPSIAGDSGVCGGPWGRACILSRDRDRCSAEDECLAPLAPPRRRAITFPIRPRGPLEGLRRGLGPHHRSARMRARGRVTE